MLTQPPTPEMLARWRREAALYRPFLRPCRKPAADLVAYLTGRYPVTEEEDEALRQIVPDTLRLNDFFGRRPPEEPLFGRVFRLKRTGTALTLYRRQDAVFRGIPIRVYVEEVTGHFGVEGSSRLWDELFAFRGLDDADLRNDYLVAEYVACLRQWEPRHPLFGREGPRP